MAAAASEKGKVESMMGVREEVLKKSTTLASMAREPT